MPGDAPIDGRCKRPGVVGSIESMRHGPMERHHNKFVLLKKWVTGVVQALTPCWSTPHKMLAWQLRIGRLQPCDYCTGKIPWQSHRRHMQDWKKMH